MKFLTMCAALMSISAQAWQDVCEKNFDAEKACEEHWVSFKKENPDYSDPKEAAVAYCEGYIRASQEARKCISKKN